MCERLYNGYVTDGRQIFAQLKLYALRHRVVSQKRRRQFLQPSQAQDIPTSTESRRGDTISTAERSLTPTAEYGESFVIPSQPFWCLIRVNFTRVYYILVLTETLARPPLK
ncbi:hypothetical protein AcV5_008018 [Taiwanofungus camphoratus]|nr:hypothetical protein AcV5_008018 [Antrodia cinnamomea]KAI0930782.1 hypothetical protein AcV7_004874 [Antrodia cinnamomea]